MALIKTRATGDGKRNRSYRKLTLKGRGTKDGSQGDGGKAGNAGDPLGGDGNGDSKIGVDRKLTGYIPGYYGTWWSSTCTFLQSIRFYYTGFIL